MMEFLVIDLNPRDQICARCGAVCPVGHGLPVDESGMVVPNWYQGDWAGVPACKKCHDEHAVKSEATDPARGGPHAQR